MDREIADNEIRSRLTANDSAALEMIWNTYSSDLFGYLVGFHCSKHEAEDTLQDLFVNIAKKRESVAKAKNLKAYLFRMARNTALNRIKKIKRIRERDNEASDWLLLDSESEVRDDRTKEIETALASLPEKQRSVLVLKFYRGKTFREIAEMLDISENTAGSRYRYGMDKLKSLIKDTSS